MGEDIQINQLLGGGNGDGDDDIAGTVSSVSLSHDGQRLAIATTNDAGNYGESDVDVGGGVGRRIGSCCSWGKLPTNIRIGGYY